MNVEPKTVTLTEYHLVLSEAEARSVLDDPFELIAQLREAIGFPATNGQKRGRRGRPKVGKAAPGRARFQPIQCPHCERMCDPRGYKRHLRTHERTAVAAA